MMRRLVGSGLALWAASLASSCGGAPRFERPECARSYDDCTDACADRCDAASSVDDSRRPPTINDNDLDYEGCTVCVSECRARAERCEAAPPPGTP